MQPLAVSVLLIWSQISLRLFHLEESQDIAKEVVLGVYLGTELGDFFFHITKIVAHRMRSRGLRGLAGLTEFGGSTGFCIDCLGPGWELVFFRKYLAYFQVSLDLAEDFLKIALAQPFGPVFGRAVFVSLFKFHQRLNMVVRLPATRHETDTAIKLCQIGKAIILAVAKRGGLVW